MLRHVFWQIKRSTWYLVTVAILCILPAAAASADGGPQCDNLNVTLSPDKNYYIFTATASGDVDTISGYKFSFGDHETYTVTFSAATDQDRDTASVTHTYQNPGTYAPTIQVVTTVEGKRTLITNPTCQTSLVIRQAGASSLPSAGANNTLRLFTATSLAGLVLYQLRLRRTSRRS